MTVCVIVIEIRFFIYKKFDFSIYNIDYKTMHGIITIEIFYLQGILAFILIDLLIFFRNVKYLVYEYVCHKAGCKVDFFF
jgi:hypothetical protein